jgi:hypothetical protein
MTDRATRGANIEKLQTARATGGKRKLSVPPEDLDDMNEAAADPTPRPAKRARTSTQNKPSALRKMIDRATPQQRWLKEFDAERRKKRNLDRANEKAKVIKVEKKVVERKKAIAVGQPAQIKKRAKKSESGLAKWLSKEVEKKAEKEV